MATKRAEIGKLKRGKEASGKYQGQWQPNPFRLKTQRPGNPGKSEATSKWKYWAGSTDIISIVLLRKTLFSFILKKAKHIFIQ
jgi:hypothetical protein